MFGPYGFMPPPHPHRGCGCMGCLVPLLLVLVMLGLCARFFVFWF